MDALHLVIGESEVEGLDILVDVVWIRGSGDAVINAIKLNITFFIVVFVFILTDIRPCELQR